jgi:acyl-CoA synthetase (AMP-forming)/AMP-acid ligase II
MLAGEILRLAAARFPDKPALIEDGRRLSYRALDTAADRVANALVALGLAKGARIALLAPNILEFPIVFYGAARAGIIVAMLSTRVTSRDLAYMLNKIGAEGLFFADAQADLVRAARNGVPSLRHVVSLGTAGGDAGVDAIAFEAFLAKGVDAPLAVEIALDDPLAMTFTGGTTGFPKAVVVTHRARYATAVTCGVEFGLDERDVAVVATPLFHAAGVFVWFHPAVMLGCTCVLLPAWDPARFIDTVETHRATAVLLVPTQLADLINHPAFSAVRLATLRHVNYAGAPMAVALFDRLRAALPIVAFTENYGQSETGPMTVRRAFHPHEKRGSVGRPAHNVELRIVDAAGRAVAPGTVGEVVTRGAHVLKEYWGDPAQTAAAFRSGDGWLWTGDLGVRDADGFITLVDRSKDMIIVGGENIYPTELENALFQHEAVAECAVFGIPDERLGEAPAAHVVLHEGRAATAEELIAFVAARVARHKRPRLLKLVDTLPKTAVGKIQKNAIREEYWRGRDRKI